jgi:L-aminopeptidase/D-esterase-like protein
MIQLASVLAGTGVLNVPVFGVYTGDGTSGRVIELDFTPKAVLLVDAFGNMHDDVNGYVGGLAIGSAGCCSQQGNITYATTWNASYTTLMIVTGGFKVNYNSSYKVYSNMSGRTYRYIAFQ